MRVSSSMRRVWMGASLAVALLSLYPAWIGYTSWWMPGIALTVFGIFALEPLILTWEVRRRGEELQITDEGVLRKLARGDSEYVRWTELREVSIVVNQGTSPGEEYFFLLAGTGTSGVLVGQQLATKHDLLWHLGKLPGFQHRAIATARASTVNQRFVLWRARPLEGDAVVIQLPRVAGDTERPRLH
jgi:hypothetical protein